MCARQAAVGCKGNNVGGAILATGCLKLLVETTTFRNCISPGTGCAIAHRNGQGFVAKYCCVNHCYSTDENSRGQGFSCTLDSNAENTKATVIGTSVINTQESAEIPSAGGAMEFDNGVILMKTINISNNIGKMYSACEINPSGGKFTLELATINSNQATSSIIMFIGLSNEGATIQNSNFLNNIDENDMDDCMIAVHSITTVKHCCFSGNKVIGYFEVPKREFNVELLDSYFDEDPTNKNEGNVEIKDYPVKSTFINIIEFTENEYCPASFDYIPGASIHSDKSGTNCPRCTPFSFVSMIKLLRYHFALLVIDNYLA